METVNLSQKFSLFASHWEPRIVGELNGQHVKLVKFRGPFVWHRHGHEDEQHGERAGRAHGGIAGEHLSDAGATGPGGRRAVVVLAIG
jgi:hypothetical protein